ncbi:MAG: DUF502 domain-containing protein [Leptolyngbyaceae bacterium]|nr:DUF502 domain-containing protein [Leptolyngbyaceae bacterium]
MLQQLKQDLKNDLIAGLLVIIPLATTIWLTFTIASWVIDFLTRIPKQLNPFPDLNPFLIAISNLAVGFAAPLIFILFIGLMARNIVGQWLLDVGERLLQAIPLAGAVYKTLKQILETILRDSNSKFRRVVLVEYPRRGIWAMAFVTGTIGVSNHPKMAEPMLSVIIPTTPNPTSGWYAIVPETDVINLAISIEDAFKVLISGGIVGTNMIAPATLGQDPTVAEALGTDPTAATANIAHETRPQPKGSRVLEPQPEVGDHGATAENHEVQSSGHSSAMTMMKEPGTNLFQPDDIQNSINAGQSSTKRGISLSD